MMIIEFKFNYSSLYLLSLGLISSLKSCVT